MLGADKFSRFEQAILPHLDTAYNLVRWLIRNDDDAANAIQDACLRALGFIGGFRGGDGGCAKSSWRVAGVAPAQLERRVAAAVRDARDAEHRRGFALGWAGATARCGFAGRYYS